MRLHHPGIVRLYEVVIHEGHPVLVYDFIDGLTLQMDMVTKKVLKVIDTEIVPVGNGAVNYEEISERPRPGTTSIAISQPMGASFRIERGEVSWQTWRFRFRIDQRVGTVVNLVRFDDGGRLRSVMYEGSLSELYVPYMDPSNGWNNRVFIDAGESAKTTDRPEFLQLLEHCRRGRGRIRAVVVHSVTRFSRNTTDHHAIASLLRGLGISLRSVTEPLDDIAKSPEIQAKWVPLRDAHLDFVEKVRAKSREMGRVVYVDLTDTVIDVAGKFVTYALFPKSVYSVMVTCGRARCKISVGYNPWSGAERTHDISLICKRYGGGGAPLVCDKKFSTAHWRLYFKFIGRVTDCHPAWCSRLFFVTVHHIKPENSAWQTKDSTHRLVVARKDAHATTKFFQ